MEARTAARQRSGSSETSCSPCAVGVTWGWAFECINRNPGSQGRRKAILEFQEMNFEEMERCSGCNKTQRRAYDDVGEVDQDRLTRCESERRQHRLPDEEVEGNAQHVHRVAVLRDSSQGGPPQRSRPAARAEMVRCRPGGDPQRKRDGEKCVSQGQSHGAEG